MRTNVFGGSSVCSICSSRKACESCGMFSTPFPEIHHFSLEVGPSKSGKNHTEQWRCEAAITTSPKVLADWQRKKELRLHLTNDFESVQSPQSEVMWLHSARVCASFVMCLPASPSPPSPISMLMETSWLLAHIILQLYAAASPPTHTHT